MLRSIVRCDRLRSVSVVIPFVVLTILFSGSVFTHVSTVERPLFVRVSATVKRSLSNCFARMVYTVYKSSTSIQKATRHQLFRSFLLLKISCAVAHNGIAKFIKVFKRLFVDSLVQVDHRRLPVK